MKKLSVIISIFAAILLIYVACAKSTAYKALIVTGQSTNNQEVTSPILKKILEQTGLFSASIVKSPAKGADMSSFSPDFSKYNVVVIDYNGDEWPEKTKTSFTDYVRNGGGVVICQSAGNSFPGWKEYNTMCGVAGQADNNGKPHEFEVRMANSENPVTKGLPMRWIHASDLLHSRLGTPAENTEVLATAYSDTTIGGSGKNEPVLIAVTYGKGRIFHTTLGYSEKEDDPAMKCSGFITTFQRGAEWAATGNVIQQIPLDFPSAAAVVIRPQLKPLTLEEDFQGIISYQTDRSTRYITDIEARIRNAAGNPEELLKIEKKMVEVLKNNTATPESKKLILRELSWMGSEYCVPAVKEHAGNPELKDEAEFALERLKTK
jgi:type 1 glutamine amidotransferase